jgi:prepilin-type N-terminal cleavage/methylation domain-containing protein
MFGRAKGRRKRQSGFSLIETLSAILVLSVGMMGGAVMIMLAATTNNRNKLDNGGTVLSQYFMETILGQNALGTGTVQVRDCVGNVITIEVDGSTNAAGAGSPLTANGNIDFTQGKIANYSAVYTACRASGDPIPYDVRWNVKDIRTNSNINAAAAAACGNSPPTSGCVVYTKQVAVAARPTGAGTVNGSIRNFAPALTIKGAVGQP